MVSSLTLNSQRKDTTFLYHNRLQAAAKYHGTQLELSRLLTVRISVCELAVI